jgi:transcriptional regulator with GAF, ATPase, and Fis domain
MTCRFKTWLARWSAGNYGLIGTGSDSSCTTDGTMMAMDDSGQSREQRLSSTFVALADTLVSDYDLIDLLHALTSACVDLLGTAAAGIMLSDQGGNLRVMASSTEQARLLELFELQNDEGPCLDSFRRSEPVQLTRLGEAQDRWPRFVHAASDAGFDAVQAHPMRLRDQTIGALNLFYRAEQDHTDADAHLAQALADVATIGILQQRTIHRGEQLAEQLQTALDTRTIIEQAKGVLAERGGLTMDAAFDVLRRYCRSQRLHLADTARGIVNGALDTGRLLG